jgi:hypothetical protein
MEKLLKIENIKEEILNYQLMSFENEEEDYAFNKKIKKQLEEVIINSTNENDTIDKALLVLAESTGCAEDQEIAEDIVSYLFDNQFINQSQTDYFYDNIGTGRWI